MCGISVVIKKDDSLLLPSIIEEMNLKIAHRGPDGDGVWVDEDLGLGHRRLSILDLSEEGAQPMHYMQRYVMVFNGEIYNYIELKKELIELGYSFSTKTDTEVILAAYHEWGEASVERFSGMFSIALYDKKNKKLFCSRDRFGIKPFYFFENEKGFFIGSEIRQLIDFLPERKANLVTILDYLVLDFIEHDNATFFEKIYKLLPGHNLVFDLKEKEYSIKKYYSLKVNPDHERINTDDEIIDKFQELMGNSIKEHLRSDVRVGSCLSGGLDSSHITALASKLYNENGKRFNALTAKSVQAENDESGFAKNVANYLNLKWHEVTIDESSFMGLIDKVIRVQEEPFRSPSIFMQYSIMDKAKEIECKVLLDGQGGDETFLGYERYYITYLKSLSFFKKIKEIKNIISNSKLTLKDLLFYNIYFGNSTIRKGVLKYRHSYLKDKYLDKVQWHLLKDIENSIKNKAELQILEIEKFNIPELLRYEDKNSMSQSIEARIPFLDHKLVEFAISIKPKFMIQNGWSKHIIRKASDQILPKEIIWRKHKFGFESPDKVWLKNLDYFKENIQQSKILKELFTTMDLEKMNSNLIWKLFNIARWESIFKITI